MSDWGTTMPFTARIMREWTVWMEGNCMTGRVQLVLLPTAVAAAEMFLLFSSFLPSLLHSSDL